METAAVAIVRRKGRERVCVSMLKDEDEVRSRSKSTCKRLLGPQDCCAVRVPKTDAAVGRLG